MTVEGVKYRRFVVRFTYRGRRVRWVRWSPAENFLRSELAPEWQDRGFAAQDFAPGSCTLRVSP